MKFARQRYQQGSLRRVMRKSGADVWEYRFRNHAEQGSPMRQITLSTLEFPTEAKAKVALQNRVLSMNGPQAFKAKQNPTFGLVIDRFIKEERLDEILNQPAGKVAIEGMAYSTAAGYLSYLRKHVKPRWGDVPMNSIRPNDVVEWLRELPLAAKTRGHLRNVLHMLFERAMLWDLIETQRNPIELVKVKGLNRRKKKILVLTAEQCQGLIALLPDPYKTMAIVAMCTGLRVSEVLALRWEHLDLSEGTMLVQHGVVNGRIGRVKTEASEDEIPLDIAFVEALTEWRDKNTSTELVFTSPSTGGCYHAGMIQKQRLKPAGERLGLQGLGWHTLRHTYRSLLDETGASVGVQQKLMRHANVATTMNIYGNAAQKAKAQANSKVVQMLIKRSVAS
jgi:integrase